MVTEPAVFGVAVLRHSQIRICSAKREQRTSRITVRVVISAEMLVPKQRLVRGGLSSIAATHVSEAGILRCLVPIPNGYSRVQD